jgi:hypothetical protein
VLAVAVAVAATTHLVTIAQYLLARRVITVPRWGFRLIVWAINHEGLALYVLLAALFALPVAARAAARGAARTASLAASAALAGDGGGPAAAAPGTNDSDMVRAGQVDAGGLAVAAAAPAPDQCDCGNCGTDAVAVTAPAPDVPDPIPPAPGAVPRRSSSGRPNLRSGRPASAPNPAERRLARAANRSRVRFARATLGAYVGIVLAATLGAAIDSQEPELSPPEEFEIVDGRAVIPLDRLEDGHLHRFAFTASDGTEVRFIVIKKNGVAYGVGLDACEICGATGYYEKAGKIICRLCDVVMNIATIGFKGGCNPIPLDHTVEDGTLSVALADLESSAEVFA